MKNLVNTYSGGANIDINIDLVIIIIVILIPNNC